MVKGYTSFGIRLMVALSALCTSAKEYTLIKITQRTKSGKITINIVHNELKSK